MKRAARGQRRRDLLEAALVCFSAHGIEGATVEMILARCGASIASLYHHFGSKDGLAAALYLEGIEGYFEKSREKRAAPAALDEAAQERLWTLSEQLLGLASTTRKDTAKPRLGAQFVG